MFTKEKHSPVIVAFERRLSDKEVDDGIHDMSHVCYHALIQILEDWRVDHATNARAHAVSNNALEMAAQTGSYDVLTGLIEDLNSRRTKED